MLKVAPTGLVAITEHRFEKEFKTLIERSGARVISCPLLEERPVEDKEEIQRFVHEVTGGELDMMIFFTGVGVRFLAREAEAMGVTADFLDALGHLTIVGRGPKPRAALRKLGLDVDLAPEAPTSEGLLDLLDTAHVGGRRVGVQLYGKPNLQFLTALEDRGARLHAVEVYDYRPASDRTRVAAFIQKLLGGGVEVIAFTSAPQIEVLFDVADEEGLSSQLVAELNSRVQVAVIGGVANRALTARGITARIFPVVPKMGALADAIIAHLGGSTG